MEYIIVGLCVVVVAVICATVFFKEKITKESEGARVIKNTMKVGEFTTNENSIQEIVIHMEMLPTEAVVDESKLVEITDSKVLAHVNNLIPGFIHAGNAANNIVQAVRENSGVLYRAIIPVGTKLTDSKAMENAVRGIYHDASGIRGHANFVVNEVPKGTAIVANTAAAAIGVAAMVVGQYYMTQINDELGKISDGISQISEFQDNEYRSRVFSLIAHIKIITDFQVEILKNSESRLNKIAQLDNLEGECTQLLGQANLTLAGYVKKNDQNYEDYEIELNQAQNWYMYQKSLLDILYKISELRYTLHLGVVSREQCAALIHTYTQQVVDTQTRLTSWHQNTTKRLNVDIEEIRRKRGGIDGIVHFLPSLFKDDLKYRSIEKNTASIILSQVSGHEETHQQDKTDLYATDVQIISREGKIYYLPENNAEK